MLLIGFEAVDLQTSGSCASCYLCIYKLLRCRHPKPSLYDIGRLALLIQIHLLSTCKKKKEKKHLNGDNFRICEI